MESNRLSVILLFLMWISPSFQCVMSFDNLHLSYNDRTLMNNVTTRSAIECSVNCANQNCVSFLFDTSTKICTIYGNDSYGEVQNVTTETKASVMTRSEPLVDCGDLCCTDCSGIYRITPVPGTLFDVYCDTDKNGGPWTVIQRRFDGSVNFYRNWEDYKWGFGNVTGEYWLGLEYIYTLLRLNQRLFVYLEGWDGTIKEATYERFSIGSEAFYYNLTLDGFSGNVEDKFSQHHGQNFSTYDKDNDAAEERVCTTIGKGGWWYKNCYGFNPNGIYTRDNGTDVRSSMNWQYFYPYRRQTPLRKCSMMVQRKRL